MKTLERRYLKLREAIENCEKTQTVAPGDFLEPITQLTKIESSIELKLFPEHWREHTYLLHIS